MAAKMTSCGCGSPRGTALRSVLLGAWMACLSLAVVMATFAQAQEGQTDTSGRPSAKITLARLKERLRSEQKAVEAAEEMRDMVDTTSAMRGAGLVSMLFSVPVWAMSFAKVWRSSNAIQQSGDSSGSSPLLMKGAKLMIPLCPLVFLTGASLAIASLVTDLTKGKKLQKQLRAAATKSALVQELQADENNKDTVDSGDEYHSGD